MAGKKCVVSEVFSSEGRGVSRCVSSAGGLDNDGCHSNHAEVHPHLAGGVCGAERRVAGVAVHPQCHPPHYRRTAAQVLALDWKLWTVCVFICSLNVM